MIVNKAPFKFHIKLRKFANQNKEICYVYEQNFPFLLDSFLTENQTIDKWIHIENKKSSEIRTFEKIVILFREKRDIQYGIYLHLSNDKTNNNLEEDFQEMFTIGVYISKLFLSIQENFSTILQNKKAWFIENIEETLFDEMLDFYDNFAENQKF